MFKPLKIVMLSLAFAVTTGVSLNSVAAEKAEVYKNASCSCCGKWIDYLKANGFEVVPHNVDDLMGVKKEVGVPDNLVSCHTAKIGGYFIEGHVPAEDIRKLLKAKPEAKGISVANMPAGSPGMESPTPVAYDTILVKKDGTTEVFAKHDPAKTATTDKDVKMVALTEATVMKVDKAAGTITLKHGKLPDGMPGMTMPYKAKKVEWLDGLKVGQKVMFAHEHINGTYTISEFELAP